MVNLKYYLEEAYAKKIINVVAAALPCCQTTIMNPIQNRFESK